MSTMMLSPILLLIIFGVIALAALLAKKDSSKPKSVLSIVGLILLVCFLAFTGLALLRMVMSRGVSLPPRLGLGMPRALEILVILTFVALILIVFAKKGGSEKKRSGGGGGWLAGLAVLLVLLMVLGGVYFMSMSRDRSRAIREFDKNYQYQVNKTVSETPAIWFEGIEERFEADIYPSRAAAVRGLGHRLEEIIRQQLGSSTESTVAQMVRDDQSWRLLNSLRQDFMEKVDIERWGVRVDEIIRLVQKNLTRQSEPVTIKLMQEDHERQLLEELRRTLRDKIDGGRCVIVSDIDEVNIKEGEIGVALSIEFDEAADASEDTYEEVVMPADEQGAVAAVVLTGAEEYTISVPFVEKPWVENYAEFMNKNPHSQWVVARSSETCSTAEMAHELGLQDAARRISFLLNGPPDRRALRSDIIEVAPEDISRFGLIADKFPQSFHGTAGPIWREAMLVDASRPNLERLVFEFTAARGVQQRRGAYIIFSFVGMIGLICLLYALVNAATKGYYSTVLRILTAVLVIAALAGFFMLRSP